MNHFATRLREKLTCIITDLNRLLEGEPKILTAWSERQTG